MYTIFINDAAIYLTDRLDKSSETNFYKYVDIDITTISKKLENDELASVYLYDADLNYLWKDFKRNFKIIEAAGGVVFNEKNEMLWIYRNNRWDLPKGKIEKGEEREVAAIREVEEECGIKNLSITKFLKTTYHIYEHEHKLILKVTFWYEMCTEGNQVLKPQIEEGITKVGWFSKLESKINVKNTFENIKMLISLQKI